MRSWIEPLGDEPALGEEDEEEDDEAEKPLLDLRPTEGTDFLHVDGWCPIVDCVLLSFGWDNTGVRGRLIGGGPAMTL